MLRVVDTIDCIWCDASCKDSKNIDEFYFNIKNLNSDKIEQFKNELKELLDLNKNDDIVIITTGSDWRLENKPCWSAMELIIYYKEFFKEDYIKKIHDIFYTLLKKYNESTLHSNIGGNLDVIIEVKKIFDKSIYYYGQEYDYKKIFPTRFLDSKFIFWNYEIYKELWNYFIKNLNQIKRHLKSFRDSKIRYHKWISESWTAKFKWETIKHFDIENWMIYFYKWIDKEIWVKMWPLRYYQYKIAYIILKYLQNIK